MEWTQVILDLRSRKLTLQEIGDMVGMSKGGVHDLMTGRGKTVVYDTGIRLMELHRKVMRRKS